MAPPEMAVACECSLARELSRDRPRGFPFYARGARARARGFRTFPRRFAGRPPRLCSPSTMPVVVSPHLRRFPPVTRSRRCVVVGECLAVRLFSCALTATAVVRIGARDRVSRKRRLPASHLPSSARSLSSSPRVALS